MIEASYFWQTVILLALGTLSIRLSFIFLANRIKISARVKEVFTFIPAAILPALIAPMVFFHQGKVEVVQGKERFLVLLLASAVCYFSKSMVTTIVFGLSALYLLTQFL